MSYSRLLLGLCMFIFAMSAFAQKAYEKPYNKWSKDDAIRMLSDSPWAKPYQSNTGATNAAARQVAREQSQSVYSGGSNPRSISRDFGPPPVTMRLHSGLPIRQALVRLQQIEAGYEKMSDTDKSAFDATRQKFLDCAICKDFYVVTLIKAVDSSGNFVEEGIFQGMTFDDLKGNVKLVNDNGDEREIVQFNAPKNSRDQAVFYFKRISDKGVPLLSPDIKDFRFVFKPEFLDSKNRFAYLVPRTFEFKVSKLLIEDKVAF